MGDGKVVVELVAKDEASQRFIAAAKAMGVSLDQVDKSGKSVQGTLGGVRQQADNVTASLQRKIAAWVSLAGVMYLGHKAMSSWMQLVSSGVQAVDDYNRAIAGSAVQMVAMSESAAPPNQLYEQWKEYFAWLWQEAIKADQKAAVSGREIFETAAELAVRGTVAKTEEAVAMVARLTDRIKALTRVEGEERSRFQIAQEIRALYEGQLRTGASLVQMISKIDAGWKDHLKTAIKTGQVLEYLDKILPRIDANTEDISNTWESIYSTLTNVKNEVLREAFGEGYKEIVSLGQEFIAQLIQEGELTEKGKNLARALGMAWDEAAEAIQEALRHFVDNPDKIIDNVEAIAGGTGRIAGAAIRAATAFADMVGWIEKAVNFFTTPEGKALAAIALGYKIAGPPGAGVGAGYGLGAITDKLMHQWADFISGKPKAPSGQAQGPIFYGKIKALEGRYDYGEDPLAGMGRGGYPGALPDIRPPGGKTGAGGGGGAGRNMSRQFDNLVDTLEKQLARATKDTFAEIAEYYDHMSKKIQEYAGSVEEAGRAQKLLDWVATAKEEAVIRKDVAEYFKREFETGKESLNMKVESLEAQREMTAYLGEQLDLDRQISAQKQEIALFTLKRKLDTKEITQELYDQAVALEALKKQARDYLIDQEALETGGRRAGWQLWRQERRREGATRGARGMADDLRSLERFSSDSLARGFIAGLRKEKADLERIGWQIAEGFISRNIEKTVAQGFDWLAGWGGGGGGTGAAIDAIVGGEEFVSAVGIFQEASVSQMAGAASLGVGALGLITGSQTLMYAAMALQAAAALMQIAETIGLIPGFHGGGVLTAHQGLFLGEPLRPDEVLLKGLLGEGVLSRKGMGIGRDNFEYINRTGQLPASGSSLHIGPVRLVVNLPKTRGNLDGVTIGRWTDDIIWPRLKEKLSTYGRSF